MSGIAECLGLGERGLVAIAGAGGKTTIAWRIAADLAAAGRRVAVTTTTRMRAGEEPEGTPVIRWAGIDRTAGEAAAAVAAGRVPLVIGGTDDKGKNLGVGPGEACDLAERLDWLVVEADGSRGLPFKIPREGEPVVPEAATHLLVVVGLAAIGRPASPETVFGHGAMLAAGLIEPEEILDAAAARRLILGPAGYLPHVREGRSNSIVVNGDDLDEAAGAAREMWHPAVASVVATAGHAREALRITNAGDRVAGVVLAAGAATRFGSQKLAAIVAGRSLVAHAVDAALWSGLDRVVVVVAAGAAGGAVVAALGKRASDPRIEIATSDRAQEGMSASLKAGLAAARPGADAIMVLLADMPAVDGELAGRVLARYRGTAAWAAAPAVGGRTGHPVVMRSDLFTEIEALDGDVGARAILEAHEDRLAAFRLDDAASQADVDTPEDLAGPGRAR